MKLFGWEIALYRTANRWPLQKHVVEFTKLFLAVCTVTFVLAPVFGILGGLSVSQAVVVSFGLATPLIYRLQIAANTDFDVEAYRNDRSKRKRVLDAALGAVSASLIGYIVVTGALFLVTETPVLQRDIVGFVVTYLWGVGSAAVACGVAFNRRTREFYAPGVHPWFSAVALSNVPRTESADESDDETTA